MSEVESALSPKSASGTWSQTQAVELCRRIYDIAPNFGAHVALSGGCLYKDGERKDCDLIFYRIRQSPTIDVEGMFAALESIGLMRLRGFGFCYKCEHEGKPVDCLFPEEPGGIYEGEEAETLDALLDLAATRVRALEGEAMRRLA